MEAFKPLGFDKPLAVITLILIVFGLIMVFSSSAVLASEKYDQSIHFLTHQIMGAVFGIALILCMVFIKRPFYQHTLFIYALLLLTLGSLALCLAIPSYGNTNRWIQFFGLRFQPSELAKISMILFFSSYLEKRKDRLHDFKILIFPLAVLFLVIFLIFKEPDYGTALLIFAFSIIMLYIGGVKTKFLSYVALFSVGPFLFYLFQASYRWNRIEAFFSPTKDSLGSGFQILQSKLAVGSGGFLGVSLGESIQKLYFLPCAHTDYIYAIIGEELGLLGTLSILALFVLLLWRGIVISKGAPNLFSQIAATGLSLALFFQALLNISIVLGLGPPTGVPLPFLSYGRSSLLCSLFGIGILLHISQRKDNSRRLK